LPPCKLLISVTSAGQIAPVREPPYFVIIDRALRDEGTSYHYLPASDYSLADEQLIRLAQRSLATAGMSIQIGAAWTTDAPFRETADAIEVAQAAGILAVEMEASALYAFAAARGQAVLCFAHITNLMGRVDGDFEKGAADGAEESLELIARVGRAWGEQNSRMQIERPKP
jgi:Uridine phosphorylase